MAQTDGAVGAPAALLYGIERNLTRARPIGTKKRPISPPFRMNRICIVLAGQAF